MATIHIIGAGVSGLAAATLLAENHIPVKLYEASAHAGGRCRTGRDGDAGLHLVSASEREIAAYLTRIGSADRFSPVAPVPFPAAPLRDYLPVLRWFYRRGTADAQLSYDSHLRDAWFYPYARAVMGNDPRTIPARGMRRFLLRHLWPRWRMVRHSLEDSFIAPALDYLETHGSSVYFSHALSRMERSGADVKSLTFGRKKVAVGAGDVVILATPPGVAQSQLGIVVPEASHAAVTLHFAVAHREPEGIAYPREAAMDLLRFREGEIAASIRVADHCWLADEEMLAARVWRAISKRYPYLGEMPLPDYTSRREKRAGHCMAEVAPVPMDHGVILLAGDWLDPLTPASLETAAANGHRAARLAMERLPKPEPRRQKHPGEYR